MTPAEIARLRALLAAATPGPWRQGSEEKWHVFGDVGNRDLMAPGFGRVVARTNEHFDQHDADAALIVAAVNALPDLLAAAPSGWSRVVGDFTEEIETLKAKLATAEAERLTLARALLRCTSANELSCPLTDARSIATAVLIEAGDMAKAEE